MLWHAAGVRAPRQIPPRDREPWKQLKDKSQEPINTRALLTDSVSGHIKAPRCLLAAREGIMLVAVKGKCNLTLNLCCNWLISRRLGKITPGHDWLEEFLLSYFSLPTMVVLTSGGRSRISRAFRVWGHGNSKSISSHSEATREEEYCSS